MKAGRSGRRTRIAVMVAGIFAAGALITGNAHAQTSTATVRGSITVGTAPANAGIAVTAVNKATGRTFRTTTQANGSYVLVGLDPGDYEIRVTDERGQPATQTFTLAVGETASIDLALPGAGALERVTIVGSVQRKDVKTSEVATSVSPQQLQRLPQVTRNFLSQADLAPGVNVDYDSEGNVRIRSGAQARSAVNVFIDGVGQKDYVLRGGTTGQDNSRGNPFPQSAIGEYKIITQQYKAEYDQVSSAVISAATRSGTNEFHGDAFVDHTSADLRSATPAEVAAGKKSDTEQQQYGVSLGGPIIRDQLHYFIAYEGKKNKDPRAVTAGGPAGAAALLPPSAQALLGPVESPFSEDLAFGKIDWTLNDANRLDLSVKLRKEKDRKHLGGTESSEFSSDNKVDDNRGDLKHTFYGDRFTNEARVTYEDAFFTQAPVSFANGVHYQFGTPGPSDVAYQGVLDAGGNNFYQRKGQKGYALQDDFTYTGLVSHVIKAGVKVKWITVDVIEQFAGTPQYYHDINSADPTTPYRVEFGAPLAGIGNGAVKSKDTQYGFYVQDDWEVTKQLTLNIGARYDFERSPTFLDWKTPADVLAALNSQDPNAPAGQTYAQTLALGGININDYISTGSNRKPFMGGFAPRLGFSFDLTGDKRYVVFGGAGRSYDRNIFDVLQLEATKGTFPTFNFFFCNETVPRPGCRTWDPALYGNAAALQAQASGAGGREVDLLRNDLKTPYTDQFSLGLRSALGMWDTTVTVTHVELKDGFVFLLGNRRPTGAFYAPGTTSGPPWGFGVPGMGSLILGTNGIESKLDSLQLQVDKPYTKASGWGVTAAYTYSHTKENHNTNDAFTYLLDYPTAADAPFFRSSVVPKHKLVATGTLDLPWGIITSAKLTLSSPNVIRDFNCTSSGCVEGILEKRSFRQFDISVGKEFAVAAGVNVGVRFDVLNLFNYRNYADYIRDWANNTAIPVANGNIDGPPRTLKVGLNVRW